MKTLIKLFLCLKLITILISCERPIEDLYVEPKPITVIKDQQQDDDEIIIQDASSNIYQTVEMGSQAWLTTDLMTNKYNNGDDILTTNVLPPLTRSPLVDIKYFWVMKDNSRVYTWYVINDSRGICPSGYKPASADDWHQLGKYMLDNNIDPGKSDFKFVAHNIIEPAMSGLTTTEYGNTSVFWSSTDSYDKLDLRAIFITISYSVPHIVTADCNKNYGYSVRCIKEIP